MNLTAHTVNFLQPAQPHPLFRKGSLLELLQLKEKVRKIRGEGQSAGRNRVPPARVFPPGIDKRGDSEMPPELWVQDIEQIK